MKRLGRRQRERPIEVPAASALGVGRSSIEIIGKVDEFVASIASAPLAPIKGSKWVPEPFVCDRGPSEGATTDASPVQNLVRTHLEAVELPERVVLLPEHNR